MKLIPTFFLTVIFSLTFLASCSTLRSGNAVKAGYDVDKSVVDSEEEGSGHTKYSRTESALQFRAPSE